MKKILSLFATVSLTLNSGLGSMILLKYTGQIIFNEIESIDDHDEESPRDDKDKDKDDNIDENDEILSKLIAIIIKSYDSPIELIDQLLRYAINNKVLSNDRVLGLLEPVLKFLKNDIPKITDYLSYLRFNPNLLINELANDWYKQSDYGTTPIAAMKNFISKPEGDIAQAKTAGKKGQWHYVAVRAGKWNWNDFYQYIAGANMNYMIKILSQGRYIGDLIDKYLRLGPIKWGFDSNKFLKDLSSAFQKLPTTQEAWPYLIKTIIPLLKIKVLNSEHPTLGFDNLTWEKANKQDLSLKTLLIQLRHLLSPKGHNDLVKLFASILTGPFGEDIIIDFGSLGYFTFPEVLNTVNSSRILRWIVGEGLKPEVLAKQIVNELTKFTSKLNLVSILDDIFSKFEKAKANILNINLKNLSSDLSELYASDNFQTGLKQLINFLNDSNNSNYSLLEILELWGVQKDEKEFKVNSPFFVLEKWINDSNSVFNQFLNILRELWKKETSGLINVANSSSSKSFLSKRLACD